MTRLGLIGAGRWGRNYIKTIAALDGVGLVRLASRNPESRRLVAPGCSISADWRDLIGAEDLDGLIIATPPSLHRKMTTAAIAAGIPVLVEKPLALSLLDGVALRDLAHAKRGLVMVDHTHVFHPAFAELKRQVPWLGTIQAIDAQAGNHGPYREDVPVLWDWGPHDVAMCLDLLREAPTEIRAIREVDGRVGGVEKETVRLDLKFGTALLARIRLSNMIDKTRRFTVRCDGGVLVYDDYAQDKLVLCQGAEPTFQKRTPIALSPELPLQRVVRAFVDAIAAGRDDASSLDLAVDVVAVLARCAQALATV